MPLIFLYSDQLIFAFTQTDLLGVDQSGFPIGIGVQAMELIVLMIAVLMMMLIVLVTTAACIAVFVVEHARGSQFRRCVDQIHTGLIESHGVETASDAQVGYDSRIVVCPTVALGADIHDERDMEGRFVLQNCLRVFVYLVVEYLARLFAAVHSRLFRTQGYTLTAAYAVVVVDGGFLIHYVDGIVVAVLFADATADTVVAHHLRLSGGVHVFLAGYAACTHTDVLERTAKSGHLVPLEVGHRDDGIGLCYSGADTRFGTVFAIDGHDSLVFATQAIGYDHIATGHDGVKTIDHSGVQMIYSIVATTGIEGVAIGQERLGTHLPKDTNDYSGVVGADVRHVAEFAKVNLDGGELTLQIEGGQAGLTNHVLQFLLQVVSGLGTKIGKIYFAHNWVQNYKNFLICANSRCIFCDFFMFTH